MCCHLDSFREELVCGALKLLREDEALMIIEGSGREPFSRVFSALFEAERGTHNSTPEKFESLCSKFGCNAITYKEPSFLIRAINYFLGWKTGLL